ncbi:MAG: AAA family ATPase [Pseudomonadales bacterium]
MDHRIHIFGASGSGTTTLGRELANRIGGMHLDTDSYYWMETDPSFTEKRAPLERVKMIEKDIEGVERWVLSGSLCSWGDPLLGRFTLAIFLFVDPTTRMERLRRREIDRYGARIEPGGDMYTQHLEFMEWARSYDSARAPLRSLHLHTEWMRRLECPVVQLNSADQLEDLCVEILRQAVA